MDGTYALPMLFLDCLDILLRPLRRKCYPEQVLPAVGEKTQIEATAQWLDGAEGAKVPTVLFQPFRCIRKTEETSRWARVNFHLSIGKQ